MEQKLFEKYKPICTISKQEAARNYFALQHNRWWADKESAMIYAQTIANLSLAKKEVRDELKDFAKEQRAFAKSYKKKINKELKQLADAEYNYFRNLNYEIDCMKDPSIAATDDQLAADDYAHGFVDDFDLDSELMELYPEGYNLFMSTPYLKDEVKTTKKSKKSQTVATGAEVKTIFKTLNKVVEYKPLTIKSLKHINKTGAAKKVASFKKAASHLNLHLEQFKLDEPKKSLVIRVSNSKDAAKKAYRMFCKKHCSFAVYSGNTRKITTDYDLIRVNYLISKSEYELGIQLLNQVLAGKDINKATEAFEAKLSAARVAAELSVYRTK